MNIAIGSDHRAIGERNLIHQMLLESGYVVEDCGTFSSVSDYSEIAKLVSDRVVNGFSQKGILLCGTGIGMSIAANKIKGVRAALCHDIETAELSRKHNDANILCLSSNHYNYQLKESISVWLNTEFEGGRHEIRVNKIKDLE